MGANQWSPRIDRPTVENGEARGARRMVHRALVIPARHKDHRPDFPQHHTRRRERLLIKYTYHKRYQIAAGAMRLSTHGSRLSSEYFFQIYQSRIGWYSTNASIASYEARPSPSYNCAVPRLRSSARCQNRRSSSPRKGAFSIWL